MSEESKKEPVVNFNEAREERLNEKRRKTERIFFKQLLGIYSVSSGENMKPIEFVDISEDGCSFQVAFNPTNQWSVAIDDDLLLRMYFSHESYLPVQVKIRNSRSVITDGVRYTRYGCNIDKSFSSYEAFKQFVKFLKVYSVEAHHDSNGVSVFYL